MNEPTASKDIFVQEFPAQKSWSGAKSLSDYVKDIGERMKSSRMISKRQYEAAMEDLRTVFELVDALMEQYSNNATKSAVSLGGLPFTAEPVVGCFPTMRGLPVMWVGANLHHVDAAAVASYSDLKILDRLLAQ